MNPYDREPPHPPEAQVLTPVRLAATAAAALPAVGLGLLCLREGLAEVQQSSLDCSFHVILGLALLVLFADVAYVVHSSDSLGWILLVGVLGFAGTIAALIAAELGGPAVLLLIVLIAGAWSLGIVRHSLHSRTRQA